MPYVHKTPGDSAQTGGNPHDSFTVTQSSTKDNDTNSGQTNTVSGGITSPGSGTVNQNTLIQGSGTTDVQDGTNTSVNSTILCPNGKTSCTKTLSAPKITQQPDDPSLYGSGKSFMFKNADPTVTFLCSLDGAAYGSCSNVTNPPISSPPYPPTTGYETTSNLASGKDTFSVETQDLQNPRANPPATATITWWITPPDPTITSSPPSNPDFSGNSYTFTFTDADTTVQYQCQIDSGTPTACNSGTSPAYSGLGPGSHTFTVTAYGANDSIFSHPDTTPATVMWTILPLEVSALGGTDLSSAGWACQPGGPIALTVGSAPYDPPVSPGTFAKVAITDAGGTAIDGLSEPTFTTDNFNSGSPRYTIDLSNGDHLWGYPPNAQMGTSAMLWDGSVGYGKTWSQVQAIESGQTVTDAYVIADGDQAPGTTDNIGNLTFNGTDYNSGTCP